MVESATSSWPPAQGLSTKDVPPSKAVVVIAASTHIAAPAPLVFDTILKVGDYSRWNSFCPRVTVNSDQDDKTKMELGTSFTFHVIMDPNKPNSENTTGLVCCDISTPGNHSDYITREALESERCYTTDLDQVYRVGWKGEGGLMSKILTAERVHEVIVTGENECEVRTWENQTGPAAYAVRWLYGKTLNQRFDDWVSDLKKFCEEKVASAKGSEM